MTDDRTVPEDGEYECEDCRLYRICLAHDCIKPTGCHHYAPAYDEPPELRY